jgi:hypothetical protein
MIILDTAPNLAPCLIAPIIGRLYSEDQDVGTRLITQRHSRNFECTLAKAIHAEQYRNKPIAKSKMNLRTENKRGNAHERAHLSYMCRATTSRSLNPASHDPDKLSKECSRYVAFNYKGDHEGHISPTRSPVHEHQEAHVPVSTPCRLGQPIRRSDDCTG